MSKSDFRRYIDEAQALPDDCVLGNVIWFTVSDGQYPADDIEKRFADLGLNPGLLPPKPKAIDAFEKATARFTGYKYAVGDDIAELLVRDVIRDGERLVRQITREIKRTTAGGKKIRLAYDKVAELYFAKPVIRAGKTVPGSERVRLSIDPNAGPLLHQGEEKILRGVLKEVDTEYTRLRDFLDGDKIRWVVRDYVNFLNGVMLKKSVYFVHSTRTEELLRLQQFLNGLGNGCALTLLPMADLKNLREEVVEAFQNEAEKDLEEVVKAIQKVRLTRKGAISTNQYVRLKTEYERVMRKAMEYSRTLKVGQERTAGAAEVALEALLALERDVVKEMEA